MLIVHNIDPKLLAQLLVEATRTRREAVLDPTRHTPDEKAADPVRQITRPGRLGLGQRANNVRVTS